jgi:class 3 adenylate cyclase
LKNIMAHLRSTVIAKTDIAGFSSRTQALSGAELSTLLLDHTHLFSTIIASHEGAVVKGEGDAFWIIFPSVTTAALAVLEMHQAPRRPVRPG